jgi:hypothetical protein
MGPTKISGLPAHILLVHLVIAAVPIAALLVIVCGLWPAARRQVGIILPIIVLGALITVPITTHAGEWLEERVPSTPLIRKHVALGKQLLPWMVGLFLVAVLIWVWERASTRQGAEAVQGSATLHGPAALHGPAGRVVIGVIAVAISIGALQQVIRTGEAGSKAVWSGNFSAQPKQ